MGLSTVYSYLFTKKNPIVKFFKYVFGSSKPAKQALVDREKNQLSNEVSHTNDDLVARPINQKESQDIKEEPSKTIKKLEARPPVFKEDTE